MGVVVSRSVHGSGGPRWCHTVADLLLHFVLVALPLLLVSCSSTPSAPAIAKSVDFQGLQTLLEERIRTGSASLDNIRAVLINVEGRPRVTHLRHGSAIEDYRHVWSVTKSVVATLVGIALGEGLIKSLDQPLSELLPTHLTAMTRPVSAVTLRQLMTMTAGFVPDPGPDPTSAPCSYAEVRRVFASGQDFIDFILTRCHDPAMTGEFAYSNMGSHLVAAVLAEALRGAGKRRTILDYAREKLFDPLGIRSSPAFTKSVVVEDKGFRRSGFAWLTDPQGIQIGALGLRLTAPDLIKIGQLHLNAGVWNGNQVVSAAWVSQVTQGSGKLSEYGLLWWLDTWNRHRVLMALGQGGYEAGGSGAYLIAVVPDLKLVVAITSADDPELPLDPEGLFPLVRDLIIPAFE